MTADYSESPKKVMCLCRVKSYHAGIGVVEEDSSHKPPLCRRPRRLFYLKPSFLNV